jgi:hypothetical protein
LKEIYTLNESDHYDESVDDLRPEIQNRRVLSERKELSSKLTAPNKRDNSSVVSLSPNVTDGSSDSDDDHDDCSSVNSTNDNSMECPTDSSRQAPKSFPL